MAKHRVRLRGCETETEGDASQMPCVPNGIKGYNTTTTATQSTISSFNGA